MSVEIQINNFISNLEKKVYSHLVTIDPQHLLKNIFSSILVVLYILNLSICLLSNIQESVGEIKIITGISYIIPFTLFFTNIFITKCDVF